MNQIIREYIQLYKQEFHRINQLELYKWKAVKQFQDHWNIDAPDFPKMLKESLSLVSNLMDSGNYFPKRMLMSNAHESPEKIRELFRKLYDEEVDILSRVRCFQNDFNIINKDNFDMLNGYQDARAVMVYLALHSPDHYYFYKFGMFKSFVSKTSYLSAPVQGKIENINKFHELCELLNSELTIDQDLIKLHKERITEDCYYDKSLNILTQDFIYSVEKYLELDKTIQPLSWNVNVQEDIIEMKDVSLDPYKVDFKPHTVNHIQKAIQNKRIGYLGELWVMEYEKKKLEPLTKINNSKKAKHDSVEIGDGIGYDISSFDSEGNPIYIEVKTTTGSLNSTYYITINELEKSRLEHEKYCLYRVYDFNDRNMTAKLLIIKGDLSHLCNIAINYRVNMKVDIE